jgi:hypothetical protein
MIIWHSNAARLSVEIRLCLARERVFGLIVQLLRLAGCEPAN